MNIFLVFCIRGNSSMKIIDLSFNVEPNLSEPMSIKIKTSINIISIFAEQINRSFRN